MLPNNEWINQEITEEIKKYMETNENENTMGCRKSCSKKEFYSNTGLPQEARKISNNLSLHLKEPGKEKQAKPKTNRRNEIIKIRTEINDIET